MRNRMTREVNEILQLVCRHQPSPNDPPSIFRQGVSVHEPEGMETWATFWLSLRPASMIAFTNPIRSKERSCHCVESQISPPLPLPLPQIKISVIKLIKVKHANMPDGSRPDFICHTVVESCGSSTFDVAFFSIENNWILPPPLSLPHTYTHTFCPCSLWACSVNRPLVRRCWCCWVPAPFGGFQAAFQ